METARSLALRPSTSGRRRGLFLSSRRFIPRRGALPLSLRFRGQVHYGVIQPCFRSLAVTGNVPVITSDCTEGSVPSSVRKEACFNEDESVDKLEMLKVCDKLIEVFLVDKPNPSDWRKLLAFSRTWSDIGPHFHTRCQERADTESDPGMRHKILRLSRKFKEVDDDVKRHNDLLEVLRRDPSQMKAVVTRRRKDFTEEFFVHVRDVAQSYHENPEQRDELINLGKASIAAVQSYDNALGNTKNIKAADAKFSDLIFSPTQDMTSKKIDNLAKKNQLGLDSSLLTVPNKAWSEAKETTLVKDEVRSFGVSFLGWWRCWIGELVKSVSSAILVMAWNLMALNLDYLIEIKCVQSKSGVDHQLITSPYPATDMMHAHYMDGLASIERMVPKEIRILKHILTIEDPQERLAALNDAFTPSVEYETEEFDYLWTTPKALYNSAKNIIDAFNLSNRSIVTREARHMLQPKVIEKLVVLKKMIKDNFL